jgi:O-antigen/teichoic acid export membrane protein
MVGNFLQFIHRLYVRYSTTAILLAIPQIVAVVVGFSTLPVILKYLSHEDYGALQFVLAVQAWIVVFSGTNVTTGAKKSIVDGKDGTLWYACYMRMKLLFPFACLLGVGALVLEVTDYFFVGNLAKLSFLVSIFLMGAYVPSVTYQEYFIAKNKFKDLAIWRIVSSLTIGGTSAFAAWYFHNIFFFLGLQLLAMAIVGWGGMIWVGVREKVFSSYRRGEVDTGCYAYGVKMIPSQIIQTTASSLSSFVVGPFFGFIQLAIFSVASKIEVLCRNFLTSSLYTIFYSDFAQRDPRDVKKILYHYGLHTFLISFLLGFCMWLFGSMYIYMYLPESYKVASIYLGILALGFPAYVIQIILKTVLEAFWLHKELIFIAIVPNVLFIVCIVAFGFIMGIIGFCIATVVHAWITAFLYCILVFYKDTVKKYVARFVS